METIQTYKCEICGATSTNKEYITECELRGYPKHMFPEGMMFCQHRYNYHAFAIESIYEIKHTIDAYLYACRDTSSGDSINQCCTPPNGHVILGEKDIPNINLLAFKRLYSFLKEKIGTDSITVWDGKNIVSIADFMKNQGITIKDYENSISSYEKQIIEECRNYGLDFTFKPDKNFNFVKNDKYNTDFFKSKYGWIDKKGLFYGCSYGGHRIKASYLVKKYHSWATTIGDENEVERIIEKKCNANPNYAIDFLINEGWVRIDNINDIKHPYAEYKQGRELSDNQIKTIAEYSKFFSLKYNPMNYFDNTSKDNNKEIDNFSQDVEEVKNDEKNLSISKTRLIDNIEIDNTEADEIELREKDWYNYNGQEDEDQNKYYSMYGWINPNGIYYSCVYGGHQSKSLHIVEENMFEGFLNYLINNNIIEKMPDINDRNSGEMIALYELLTNKPQLIDDYLLRECGWVKFNNPDNKNYPYAEVSIAKHITKKQIETVYKVVLQFNLDYDPIGYYKENIAHRVRF